MTFWRCEPCKFEGEADKWPLRDMNLALEPFEKRAMTFSRRRYCPKCGGFIGIAPATRSELDVESFALYRARAARLAQKAVDAALAEREAAFVDSVFEAIFGPAPTSESENNGGSGRSTT